LIVLVVMKFLGAYFLKSPKGSYNYRQGYLIINQTIGFG